MNIGEASERSGLPAKTIRYYEDISLVAPDRAENGYRDYSSSDVHRLRFLHRARNLGFSIDEIRDLLKLWADRRRSARDVKTLTERHIAELDRKIAELGEMRATLAHLAHCCDGGDRPDCPIIESLAGEVPLPHRHSSTGSRKRTETKSRQLM